MEVKKKGAATQQNLEGRAKRKKGIRTGGKGRKEGSFFPPPLVSGKVEVCREGRKGGIPD
jgi:hypothetical protein